MIKIDTQIDPQKIARIYKLLQKRVMINATVEVSLTVRMNIHEISTSLRKEKEETSYQDIREALTQHLRNDFMLIMEQMSDMDEDEFRNLQVKRIPSPEGVESRTVYGKVDVLF